MRTSRAFRMRLIGWSLIVHGLLHALAGLRVTDITRWASISHPLLWSTTVFWFVATIGLLAAGVGYLGVTPFDAQRRRTAIVAASASIALLVLWWQPWAIAGVLIDIGLLAWVSGAQRAGAEAPPPAKWPRLERVFAIALIAYGAVLILSRPAHMRWGNDDAQLTQDLPGDAAHPNPNFRIQHAVTINAPARKVWPWLVQLGHDQGGFYSYSELENLFGLSVRNADRIHPEWQRDLRAGDSIFGTPNNYLGTGRRFGWRVGDAIPNRLLLVEGWGAFVIDSISPTQTRLIVRTQARSPNNLKALLLAPLGLSIFEPAHFIMEREMLQGIKTRAERWNNAPNLP